MQNCCSSSFYSQVAHRTVSHLKTCQTCQVDGSTWWRKCFLTQVYSICAQSKKHKHFFVKKVLKCSNSVCRNRFYYKMVFLLNLKFFLNKQRSWFFLPKCKPTATVVKTAEVTSESHLHDFLQVL